MNIYSIKSAANSPPGSLVRQVSSPKNLPEAPYFEVPPNAVKSAKKFA